MIRSFELNYDIIIYHNVTIEGMLLIKAVLVLDDGLRRDSFEVICHQQHCSILPQTVVRGSILLIGNLSFLPQHVLSKERVSLNLLKFVFIYDGCIGEDVREELVIDLNLASFKHVDNI